MKLLCACGGVGMLAAAASAQPCAEAWSNQFLARDQSPYNLAACGLIGPVINGAAAFDPDGPAGPTLMVFGYFSCMGGFPANSAASWNGSTWSSVGDLGRPVYFERALPFDEDGGGPFPGAVYVLNSWGVARWNHISWTEIPPTLNWLDWVNHINNSTHKLIRVRLGGEDALWASQMRFDFSPTYYRTFGALHRLRNGSWVPYPGFDGLVEDGVSVPNSPDVLIAHYELQNFVSVAELRQHAAISRFNEAGTIQDVIVRDQTLPAQTGVPPVPFLAMAVYDPDGAGPGLTKTYVGGAFSVEGTQGIHRVAELVGTTLVPISGISDGSVDQLIVLDEDGSGFRPPALFATGDFSIMGGVPCTSIARWDGERWSAVGSGLSFHGQPVSLSSGYGESALSLVVIDNLLFAAGRFDRAGMAPANGIARWDGTCGCHRGMSSATR